MKTVLLLGAGVTRAARPKISLGQRAPLDTDFFTIAKAVSKDEADDVLQCLHNLVGDYAYSLSESLETVTTYLYLKAIEEGSGSLYHKGFLKLLELLEAVLADTTNSIRVGPRSLIYRFILSELGKLDRFEDLTIITFNYDLLLERVLESISLHGHPEAFVFPGCYRMNGISHIQQVRASPQFESKGYSFKGAAILKLHGSMNWQSTHTSASPTPAALSNPNRNCNVLDLTEITPGLQWKRRSGGRMVYMKPIIVPPVSGKRSMLHHNVVNLWSIAASALNEADRVVIGGYSCPPLDLEARILLSETLRANDDKRVYVIDPNPQAASKFLELCGVDHITIYTSISSWIADGR